MESAGVFVTRTTWDDARVTAVTSTSAAEVLVVWGPATVTGDPDDLLRSAVATYLEVDPVAVQTGRLCPRCAGTDHGRPVVLPAGGDRRPVVHVSLSRAAGRTVVAVTTAGPVGVDVEHVDAAGFDTFARVGLHRDEVADDAPSRTRTWVRKESLVKATGDGLTVDLRDVQVTAPAEAPGLVRWDARRTQLPPVQMVDLDVPNLPGRAPGASGRPVADPLLASLTVLAAQGLVVTTRLAGDLEDRDRTG